MRFRPAGEGIELGGDFYDLFAAGDGAWTALIGDVQGKGPDAAAVTALARHTMRAAAAYESRPSGVLGAAAPARCATRPATRAASAPSATRTCASAASSVALELACGGHPLPLVVHPDGARRARSAGSARCWAPTSSRC